jgi:lipopolysaccharide export system protein LptA
MNHYKKNKLILLYVISGLSVIFSSSVMAGDRQKMAEQIESSEIVIKSDSLEIDNKRKIVVFTGNVDARRDNFIINCQKMHLHYLSDPAEMDSGKEDLRVDKIVATGKVKITRTNGGLAMAEQAIYYQDDERVVLTGKPVVKQGNDFVEGAKITLLLKENRSIVEGSENSKVRAVLSPKNKKR